MRNGKVYIDVSGTYTRVALVEDGELAEFYVESSEDKNRLVGNIYKGRVVNVLQGMQAAFVDIGREKNAFLFVSDIPVDRRDVASDISMPEQLTLKVGQEIMCQVIKDEVGTKGARISANVSIVGKYIVSTPHLGFYGISRKIEEADRREKLLAMLQVIMPRGWGAIARTQSATVPQATVEGEVATHEKLYEQILRNYESAQVGDLLYRDGDIVYRTSRDVINDSTTEIHTNSATIAQSIAEFLRLSGAIENKTVVLHDSQSDLFGENNLTAEVNKLMSQRVCLKSGGTLVIDKTEALTAIDVNSARFVGSTYLEDTVFRVNLEAATEIARQLRLRNIGGIIIVDFIDMESEEHRQTVLATLEAALKADRIKTRIAGMTSLGLVQITRKKMRNDVSHYLQEPCPHCHGTGKVIAASVVVPKVSKLITKELKRADALLVTVHPAIATKLLEGALSGECATIWQGKRIYVIGDELLNREDVRIKALKGAVLSLPDHAKLIY